MTKRRSIARTYERARGRPYDLRDLDRLMEVGQIVPRVSRRPLDRQGGVVGCRCDVGRPTAADRDLAIEDEEAWRGGACRCQGPSMYTAAKREPSTETHTRSLDDRGRPWWHRAPSQRCNKCRKADQLCPIVGMPRWGVSSPVGAELVRAGDTLAYDRPRAQGVGAVDKEQSRELQRCTSR
jgi:hypothetical protein